MTGIPSYMHHQKLGPRAEYRRQEGERVKNSATLAQTFSELKSLTVNLAYSSPESCTPCNHLKYTVNLASAKALFRFDCPNQECVQGDFDLSADLANAVAFHQTTITGKHVCQGWRDRTAVDRVPCGHILYYTMTVGY